MTLARLIKQIETRLEADGYTVADYSLDLAQHVPSNPEAANASSVHPDNELIDSESRHLHRDTIRVLTVTRLTAKHQIQDSWTQEANLRHTVAGVYDSARVYYFSTVRGYHPSNKGWYLTTQLFNTVRRVRNEH